MALVRFLLFAAFVAFLSGQALAWSQGSTAGAEEGTAGLVAGNATDNRSVPDAVLGAESSMDDPDDDGADLGEELLAASSPGMPSGATEHSAPQFSTTGLAASLGVPDSLFRPPRTLG